MARVAVELTNFTGGELSPRLDGRTDLTKYSSGCSTLQNLVVYPHGSAARRPGSTFIAEVADSDNKTRLIPFEFSTTQTYMLEFSNLKMRVYKDKGAVLEGDKTITGITQANPAVVTATSHNYSNGDEVLITGVSGMTEVNSKRFLVANKTTNTFELQNKDSVDVDSTGFTAYSSGGVSNKVFELTTPYTTAQLFDLKFAQSADVMYITHPEHEVEKLSRTGHTSWTLTDVDFTKGPMQDANITTTTLNPGATAVGTGVSLAASATTGINNGSGFLSTDVGRFVFLHSGYAKITGVTDTTNATIEILTTLSASTATADWRLGAFSDTTGHPSCVTFFEQRLVFAGTTDQPQTIFFSKSGDYENMDANIGGSVADDDAIIYTIASNQVNAIRFMTATRTLIIGTAGGEFTVSGGGTDSAITPTNILIKKQSNHGSANVDAISVGNATLFLQRAKRKIRELAYNFDVDGYIAPDMTILAEHITEGGLTQISYQQEPNQIVYGVRSDGELVGLTYQREQQVTAWHRHIFGGRFGNATITVTDFANIANGTRIVLTKADGTTTTFTSATSATTGKFHTTSSNNQTATNLKTLIDADSDFTATVSSNVVTITESSPLSTGFLTVTSLDDSVRLAKTDEGKAVCESVAVIPTDDTEYEVYVIVKRTINGATRRFVEVLNVFDFDQTDNTSFNFLDSQLSYSGSAATTISGLDHLEGQTVSILADGATHPDKTVSSGSVTLDRSALNVKIGLAYTSLLQTMRLNAGSQNGTSQGKTKRIYDITVRMFETIGVEVGPNLNDMERIPFRSSTNLMDEGIPPFTGDKEVEFRGNYETDGFIFVRQTQPLPFTILSLYPRLTTNDG
ncbi:putative tail tubular B [Pelagibacter phage HTVC034P]|nr:putative tail tubular B [Pelagibacter phage HTVC034P]